MYKKMDEIKGPYTCDRFNELNEGVCNKCPLREQIKSPIVLGKRIKETEGEVTIEAPVSGKSVTKEYDIPIFPNHTLEVQRGVSFCVAAMLTGI